MSIVDIEKLENLLQTNWADYMDSGKVMRLISDHVRDTDFQVLHQANMPKRHTKISVTNVSLVNRHLFEAWFEITVPKDYGVVVGTVILNFDLSGFAQIADSFGTEFRPESLKQCPAS
jgi:hypothetical protein